MFRLLAKLRARLEESFARDHNGNSPWDLIWKETYKWDRANSNHDDLIIDDEDLEWIQKAFDADESEGYSEALRIWTERAWLGSVWSMLEIARYHERGVGVPKSLPLAARWYRRAIKSGSQLAVLEYSGFLAKRGDRAGAIACLQEEVDRAWLPAMFRQACHQNMLPKPAINYPRIRALLIPAADAGHPGARALLFQLMARGKFGIHLIPLGIVRYTKATFPIFKRNRTVEPA